MDMSENLLRQGTAPAATETHGIPHSASKLQRPNAIAEKSFDFAVSIYSLCKKIRFVHKEYDLSRQLLSSGTSIGANVAEGVRAQSKADFISKMSIALKEANETDYWLKLLNRVGLIEADEAKTCLKDVGELIAILMAITKSAAGR